MADYRDIFSGTLGKVVDRVKGAAESSGVAEVYAQGAGRARAFGQIAKLSLAINGENEELKRVYTEIGRLYFAEAQGAPEGVFAKRLCQGRVYWRGPLAPHRAQPNKLERERTCQLLDTRRFLAGKSATAGPRV